MLELPQRFQDKIQPEPNCGCWLWEGAQTGTGYGGVWFDGRMELAHIAVYEFYKGPVPLGAHLDHLCRVRCCCNPDHLEPVTCKTNVQRGNAGLNKTSQTHCKRGHEFTPENTRQYVDRGVWVRQCRACDKIRRRRSN